MLFHVRFYYWMHIHFQFLSLPNIFSLASFWWVSLYFYPGKILCWEVIFTCSLGVIPDLRVLFAYCIFFYSFFFFKLSLCLFFSIQLFIFNLCYSIYVKFYLGHFQNYDAFLIAVFRQLPWWLSGKEPACQCRRGELDLWVGKIPRRSKWEPIPVFFPGKCHGQRSLVVTVVHGVTKDLDMA